MEEVSETVQISEDFQSKQCQLCKGPNNVLSRENLTFKRQKICHDNVQLHLPPTVPSYTLWPAQDYKGQGNYGKVKGQIKVTP